MNFGHWDLFGICDLLFGILVTLELQSSLNTEPFYLWDIRAKSGLSLTNGCGFVNGDFWLPKAK